MKDNKIFLTKKVKDKNLENKIKTLNFFSQYGNFKDIDSYKMAIFLTTQKYLAIQLNTN